MATLKLTESMNEVASAAASYSRSRVDHGNGTDPVSTEPRSDEQDIVQPTSLRSPIRIGIDGRLFTVHHTGIGRYILELCKALDRLLPSATFYVYNPFAIELPPISERWIARVDPRWPGQGLGSSLWLKARVGKLCIRDGVDVFWGCCAQLPVLPRTIRAVITLYDLNEFVTPQTMSIRTRVSRGLWRRDLRRADAIVTISHGTARRLLECMSLETAAVVPPAVSNRFAPQGEAELARVLAIHGLKEPYFLSVATWEPRKNLTALVRAFLDLRRQGALGSHQLVLVGGRGWKDRRLAALVTQAEGDGVVPLGYVPDENLPALYSAATALVFPSLYEGFGMPVLEARACGTLVVVSDVPELREAGGDSAIYIPPSEDGIRAGLLAAAELGRGLQPSGLWSWEKSANALVKVLVGERERT